MQSREILLLAVLCLCGIFTQAQTPGSIRGLIVDDAGAAAVGLTVKIEGTTLGEATDHSGAFVIHSVPAGNHTLVISGIGFKTQERSVIVKAGSETVVSVSMQSVATELDEVMVVGRSEVKEINRQAYNVTAVDATQLYNTTLDLAGALDRVSGVRVRESGGVGSSFDLSLNGFSGNHVRYFIDGIPMDNFGTSFQINNIPINAAERIEVYKGVVPTSLGSDALGGAINIVTSDRHRNYVDVSYAYGSFNTHRTVINAAATSKNGLTVQLSAFQNYSDNNYKINVDVADINTGAYTRNAWVPRFHDNYHNETLIASVGVVKKKYADKLLVGVTLGKNYKEIQTGARMLQVFGAWHRRGDIVMPTLKYKKTDLIKGVDVIVNANFNLGTEQNIDTVNALYDWYGNKKVRSPLPGGERSRSLYTYKNNNGLTNATFNYRISQRQNLSVTDVFSTFNRQGADATNPETVDPVKKTQKNVLGVSYTYGTEDHFSVSLFGKYITQKNVIPSQDASGTVNKLGYGVVGTYFITPALQVKGSYELTNRMPEANELFGDVENIQGNPNLKPEKSDNINVGATYNFAVSKNSRFMVNVNGIYRYAYDFIFTRLDNNQQRLISDNRDGVRTSGVDGDIRYSFKRWLSVGATLTYQKVVSMQRVEPNFTGISPTYKKQFPNKPFLFGNGDVSATIPNVGGSGNTLTIGYNALFVYRFYLYWPLFGNTGRAGDKYDVTDQLVHDVNVVYSLKNGRYNIGLECRNFTDTLAFDNFSLQKPGRAFYVNLRYFFNKA